MRATASSDRGVALSVEYKLHKLFAVLFLEIIILACGEI